MILDTTNSIAFEVRKGIKRGIRKDVHHHTLYDGLTYSLFYLHFENCMLVYIEKERSGRMKEISIWKRWGKSKIYKTVLILGIILSVFAVSIIKGDTDMISMGLFWSILPVTIIGVW